MGHGGASRDGVDPICWTRGFGGSACHGGGSAGATGGGSSCLVIDTDGISSVSTVAYGVAVGVPGLSGSAGPILSNTEATLLAGYGICGNVSGGVGFGGAGALCGSVNNVNDTWTASGGWTFYLGVSLTTPSVEGGYTYTYTWVDQLIKWPW